ncbi:unnamed protein product [Prunus brigantina]
MFVANKHICARGVSDVTLQISNERSWPVKCIITVYNGRPSTRFHNFGWGAFSFVDAPASENHLEEGDACRFDTFQNVLSLINLLFLEW